MKINLFLVFLALAAFSTNADTTWVPDTVSGVWTAAGNPYIVTGNCYVATGESLYITEGVRIVSGDTADARIFGANRLKMQGSPAFPIYITRVRIDRPFRMEYCKIDSCHLAVTNPIYMSYVEITNCYNGIYVTDMTATVQFCNIMNCFTGATASVDRSVLKIYRSIFHHNNVGLYSACCLHDETAESRIYYCTFVDNDYSIKGTTCEYYWGSGTGGYWERATSLTYVYNSLICDEYLGHRFNSYNSPYIPDLGPEYYPDFVNPSLCDYRLDSLSLYIDMAVTSYGFPPDPFYGDGPDIGAFESPYTAQERCVFYNTSYTVSFPLASIGDTSFAFKSLINNGTSNADSIRILIEPPFGFVGIVDSSLPVLVNTTLTFSYFPDYVTSCDTALLIWYVNDLSDTVLFILNGYNTSPIEGEISGTLSVDLSPYVLVDAYIPCGESLIIEPGVEITGELTIYGCLIADGTVVDSIFFENCNLSFKTDTLCSPDSSRFSFCDFINSTISAIDSVSVRITNSNMTGNCTALDFRNKSVLWLEGCSLKGFFIREANLLYASDSKISLVDCIIADNTMQCYFEYYDFWSGAYYFYDLISVGNNSVLFIDNCSLEDNSLFCSGTLGATDFSRAADLCIKSSFASIHNSVFRNNINYSLVDIYSFVSGNPSEVLFTNCIFQAGEYIHGENLNIIRNTSSFALFSNCNFIQTTIKNYTYRFAQTDALNCLFFGIAFSGLSSDFHNCILPPGTSVSDSSTVFFGTPTFASDSSYMLAPTSIGIDMGTEFAVTDSGDTIWAPTTDFYGNPRPSGAGFDIGAAEFQWETYTANISCGIGWNLVSCPVADTVDVTEIFPFATGPAFSYDNSSAAYLDRYAMIPGVGYWALSSDTSAIELTAGLLDSVTIDIHRGWNLIGSVGGAFITAGFGGWFMPPAYGYNPAFGGYFGTTALLPGCAYWVLSSADTTITIRR